MITALLIVHGLLAVALLGAITHQAASVWWPRRKPVENFVGRFRAVAGAAYSNAIVLLYVSTAILGAIIYPEFRVSIRGVIEELDHRAVMGAFELKEHFVVVGLAILAPYWLFWRVPLAEQYAKTRAALTAILAFIV
ncbi:MAG TPA: hypothetical protein VK663_04150 [Burkholderiales bacterium]|nr:hypothetical protein [Burkholderiales bacterium]